MNRLQKYIKLANFLDNLGHYNTAKIIDAFIKKHSDLELTMEKEQEEKKDKDDDEDGEEIDVSKKKKITLKFD